jgi:bifunctional UDP-N-acetylglucosamine pyrophosphorylase/glucosamine-1-phosphate N-acetyltransferase
MVCAVVDACLEAGCSRVVAVVGYKQELVRDALAGYGDAVEFAVQDEQHGTGHAVACARDAYEGVLASGEATTRSCSRGRPADPRRDAGTLLERHRDAGAAAALATSVIDDPSGYGRIVRDASGGSSASSSRRTRPRRSSRSAR